MNLKYAFSAALLCCPALCARVAAQPVPAEEVQASTQPAAAAPLPDRDPALMKQVRELKEQMHEEFTRKRGSTPEEARQFRTRAVTLSVEYQNMLHKKAQIPLIGAEDAEIHELIYAHPRIAAHIFSAELEICKSTDAYDYKAQAEAVYGDKVQAEADWTAAIALSPDSELLRHRGHLYLGQRKYDKAIEDFTGALKAGGVAPLYHSRALAYYRSDDYARAAEDLGKFFELNTDKVYSGSVAASRICSGLRKHGFAVEGCAAEEKGGEKK
jgi:tetratricopeptide (TPR) repeat protein